MISTGYKNGIKFTIELQEIGDNLYLATYAAVAFLAMQDAAIQDGLPLKVNTAFRSMEYQSKLFKTYVKEMAKFERKERATKPAPVARPGYSTHQSGISVDINRAVGDDLKTVKPDSPTDLWFAKNAARFGYVRDVIGEPWHLTYKPGAYDVYSQSSKAVEYLKSDTHASTALGPSNQTPKAI